MGCIASPWMTSSFTISPSSKSFSKFQLCPSPCSPSTFCFRIACQSRFSAKDLKFVLHEALDPSATDTSHARAARNGFHTQIQKLSAVEREASICVNRSVDLGRTALYIAAEDDSLLSHSSVPLPVDAFQMRLDSLTTDYFPYIRPSWKSSPEDFLDSLEHYLYVKKGFRKTRTRLQLAPRTLYLHSVLTHRSGSPIILSLIYSEILKMLRLWDLLDFDVELFYPHDPEGLPRAYNKKKSKESDQPHIMTSESLLLEMLRSLKAAYWPFQHDHAKSLFMRAADAANCTDKSSNSSESFSGFQLASAKAAQHRLDRGVWTSVLFGDMRCALSACERLILLEADIKELRDYGVLLYHCSFYEEALQYLKLYMEKQQEASCPLSKPEADAIEKLMVRLNLILMEEGWSKPSHPRNFLSNNTEPW